MRLRTWSKMCILPGSMFWRSKFSLIATPIPASRFFLLVIKYDVLCLKDIQGHFVRAKPFSHMYELLVDAIYKLGQTGSSFEHCRVICQ
jgi:hypothetical protein